MSDQRTAAHGNGSAGTGGWSKGRWRGRCIACSAACIGREYARSGLCWRCRRGRTTQLLPRQWCLHCNVPLRAHNHSGYCYRCQKLSRIRYRLMTGHTYRSPLYTEVVDPAVDTTREERLIYYTERAAADLPLFSEGRYSRPDLR